MTATTATGEPAPQSFVTGLRADQDALTAGLTLRWSSGSVEGYVNRTKMLKRQMHGRANPYLLRRRILLTECPHGNCARASFHLLSTASAARRSRLVLEPDRARHVSKARVIWRRPDCLKASSQ
jgi:hypothetical protein